MAKSTKPRTSKKAQRLLDKNKACVEEVVPVVTHELKEAVAEALMEEEDRLEGRTSEPGQETVTKTEVTEETTVRKTIELDEPPFEIEDKDAKPPYLRTEIPRGKSGITMDEIRRSLADRFKR